MSRPPRRWRSTPLAAAAALLLPLLLAAPALTAAPALPAPGALTEPPGPRPPPVGRVMVDEGIDAYADAVVPLDDGGFVVAGAAVPLVGFGGGVALLPIDGFVARYDASGQRAWAQVHDLGGQDAFRDVVVGPGGEVVAVGETYDGAYLHRAVALGWGLDGAPAWSAAFDLPGATSTVFVAAVRDGEAVVVLGFAAVTEDGEPSMHPFITFLGPDGAVQRVVDFAALDGVVWHDIALVGPGLYEVAGSLAGALSLGPCAGRVDAGGAVVRHHCTGQPGSGLYGVVAGPGGSAASGLSKAGPATHAAAAAWDGAGAARWRAEHDLQDPASERRSPDLAMDAMGRAYVAVINGTVPTNWLAQPTVFVNTALRGGPLLGLNVLAYAPDGTLAWSLDHREAGHHVYPLGAAYGQGRVLVAGARADAATARIHPLVMELVVG